MRTRVLLTSLLLVAACSHTADITGPSRSTAADGALVARPVKKSNVVGLVGNGTYPSPPGLVACYSGRYTGNDVVGGHNAVVSGGVSYQPGYFTNAFSIDDINADIAAPAAANWDYSAADGLSLSAWFYGKGTAFGGGAGDGPIAEFENGAHIWWWSQFGSGPNTFFADFAMGPTADMWRIAEQGSVLTSNAWMHGVATYSKTSGVLRLYVNGVLVNTTPFAGPVSPISGASPFHIGRRVVGSFGLENQIYAFNGMIDEVQVYNRELSATDVAMMYAATGTMCVPPATAFKLLQQPSTTSESGVPLAVQPWVALVDASGNIVANGNSFVTATLASGSQGTLSGTTTVQADTGIAKFTNLTINGGGNNQLVFTVSGGSSGSLPSTGPGAPGTVSTQVIRKLGITTQPVGALSGAPLSVSPVVELQDAAGLHMNGTNIVQATIGGTGILGGTTSVAAVNGYATFNNLGIAGAGTSTLTFSSAGLASVTSIPITTTALGASGLGLVPPTGAGGVLTGESGKPLTTMPVLNLLDAVGGIVLGSSNPVTVALTTPGGTLLGTKTVNASNGVATFTDLQINAPAGNYVLTFTSGSFPAVTATVAVYQVTRSFALIQDGTDVYSGSAIAPAPSVTLLDAAGIKNAGGTDSVSVVNSGLGASIMSGTVTVKAVAGVATFPNIIMTGRTGYGQPVYDLVFSAAGATPLGVGVRHNVWLPGTNSTNLAVGTAAAGAESGVPFTTQPTVKIVDGQGTLVTTAANVVTASVTTAGGTLVGTATATAVNGVATFTNLQINGAAGNYVLTFTSPGLTTAASTVAVTQKAHQLVVTTQPPASVMSGVVFATQPAVTVYDAAGLKIASDVVTASAGSGTATLGGTLTATAVNGVATFSGLKLTGSGSSTIKFTDGAATATSNSIIIQSAVVATSLAVQTQPAGAVSGVAFTTQPVVQIRDGNGALMTTATNAVTVAIASGTGTLAGTTTVNAVGGVATFNGLKITGTGTFTLTFTSTGLTPATSAAFTVTAPQIATKLGILTQPSATSESGVNLAVQPVIEIRDASGNRVATSSAVVTATISNGSCGEQSHGQTFTATAVNGVATFSGIHVDGSGPHVITFTSTGLTGATSSTITTTQVVRSMVITRQPSGATSGHVFTSQPRLEMRDAANLLVKGATTSVTTAIASGTGTLAGKTTVSASGGVVTYTNLQITGSGAYTLKFTATGLATVTSASFSIGTPGYTFGGFYQSLDAPPALNYLAVSKDTTIEFSLGGDKGSDIFWDGFPATQQISCSSKTPSGSWLPLSSDDGDDEDHDSHWFGDDHKRDDGSHESWSNDDNSYTLTYNRTTGHYSFKFSPINSWYGTCRQLTLKFTDGQSKTIFFSFNGR